jgi:LysM repeat protein
LALSVLVVLAVVTLSSPQKVHAAVKCEAWYTVKEGDKTPYIAQTFGLKWRDIALANNLVYPYHLYPGQRLCIPDPDSLESIKEKPRKGKVSIASRGNFIIVTATNFPKKGVSYVKVRDGNASIGGWFKLGRMKVPKISTSTKYFTLPKKLKGSIWLEVCLKDGTTNKKICQTVLHRYQ